MFVLFFLLGLFLLATFVSVGMLGDSSLKEILILSFPGSFILLTTTVARLIRGREELTPTSARRVVAYFILFSPWLASGLFSETFRQYARLQPRVIQSFSGFLFSKPKNIRVEVASLGIHVEIPAGWHGHHVLFEGKDAFVITNADKAGALDDSPMFYVTKIGSSITYPPNAYSSAIEENLKRKYAGYKIISNEIVKFGGDYAIKVRGGFKTNDQPYILGYFVMDRNKNTYVMQYIMKANVEEVVRNLIESLPTKVTFAGSKT